MGCLEKTSLLWGVEVQIFLNNESQISVTVPFLLRPQNLKYSILETNAIKHLSALYKMDELHHVLQSCLPNHSSELLDPLVHLLQSQK